MVNTSCKWVEENLAAYLLNGLSEAEQHRLQDHLPGCPACTQTLNNYQRVHTSLATHPAEAGSSAFVLSAQARQRIGEQVHQKTRTGNMMQNTFKIARGVYSLAALAALAALIIFGVSWMMRLRPQPGVQPPASATPTAAVDPTAAVNPTAAPDEKPAVVSNTVTLTFAVLEYDYGKFQTLAEEFQRQHPEIRVQVVRQEQLVGQDYENADARLVQGADVIYRYVDASSVPRGLLLDLQPYIASTPGFQAEDFFLGMLEAYQWQGGTWALPAGATPNLVLYDRTIFDQAGAAYPALEWDQAAFLRTAEALARRSGEQVTQYGFIDQSFLSSSLIETMLPSALAQGRIDTPEIAATLDWINNLPQESGAVWTPPTLTDDESRQQASDLIQNGGAAMWSDSLYNYIYYTQQQGRKLGLALSPTPLGPRAYAYTQGYFISAGTQHPQEAWLWVEFLSRQPLSEGPSVSGPPDAPMTLPARRSVAASSGYWEQFDEQDLPAVQYAAEHLTLQVFDPAWPQTALWLVLEAVRGGANLEEALAEAQQKHMDIQAQSGQVKPAPLAVTPPKTRPEAAQIGFFNGGVETSLLFGLVEEFEALHPEIQVNVLDYEQSDGAACFASANIIEDAYDLTPLLENDPDLSAQDFFPAVLAAHQRDGRLRSLPWQATPHMIHYNKALFDAAGLPYPSQDWTIEDFRAAAQALTIDTPQGRQYGYVSQSGESDDLASFVAAQGVTLWDEQGRPNFATPQAAAAVQWYTDLALVQGVMPLFPDSYKGTLDEDGVSARSALINGGRAAMWSEYYPYNAAYELPGEQFGWASWPGSAVRATTIFYEGYSISTKAEPSQVSACWQWIKFLIQQPEAVLGVPALPAVQNAPEYLTDGQLADMHNAEDLPLLNYVLEHSVDAYTYQHIDINARPMLDALLIDIYNGMSIAQALAKAQQAYLIATPTPAPAPGQ